MSKGSMYGYILAFAGWLSIFWVVVYMFWLVVGDEYILAGGECRWVVA